MTNGVQLKEEMSTWVWELPNYFKIDENIDYKEKLINLMIKGLELFKNSSFTEITLSNDEEILHKTYIYMVRYLQKIDSPENKELSMNYYPNITIS